MFSYHTAFNYLAILAITAGILGVHSQMYHLFTPQPSKQMFFKSTWSILFESPFTLLHNHQVMKPY